MDYKFLDYAFENGVATVKLNRPQIHNAFNDELIEEITDIFKKISSQADIRVSVITGEGRSFCAGADLNWMSSMVNYSKEENIQDSTKLAHMFEAINNCSKPVIGKINGAALGGGVGIVSVCDYAITHEKSKFGFTETRLGLVPAVISPYCIRKIGESHARAWFLSGERFTANKAMDMGLIHEVTSVEDFEARFSEVLKSFLLAGPKAAMEAKELVKNIVNNEDKTKYTVETIAKLRVSEEGQEGMSALLEKRKANWMKS